VSIGDSRRLDECMEVPIILRQAREVYSLEAQVRYDSPYLEVISVSPQGFARDYLCEYSCSPGLVTIAMAGREPLEGDREVCSIRFRLNNDQFPVSAEGVVLDRVLLNEGCPEAVPLARSTGRISPIVELKAVTPNPSTGDTEILYRLAASANVVLSVYDARGRLIRTLVCGSEPSGVHRAVWDGLDSSGQEVVEGLYFCRIQCGEMAATEKLLLVK
jgi:hypothetical protein